LKQIAKMRPYSDPARAADSRAFDLIGQRKARLLGSTGTIAARLLLELGTSRLPRLRKVREVRPGAIENSRQERFVHEERKIRLPAQSARNPNLANDCPTEAFPIGSTDTPQMTEFSD
jgi:hypothetical protein